MPDVVVMVSGCYDILHGGHVEFFTQARALGTKLIVCVASDEVLWAHKRRKSSIPLAHKIRLLEALTIVDEVVVGECKELGFDFKDHFLNIRPNILVVTEDDKWESEKIKLCESIGTTYIRLPKTLNYEKVSTSDILGFIQAPHEVPLRVDFGGGWLDVPKFSRPDAYIVNCAISPMVSLNNWPYYQGGGLGGSAAYAMLMGRDGVESELDLGVGWQDPAIIKETGLCAWRSGNEPILDIKINPDFLNGKMAIMWLGKEHYTPGAVDLSRDYDLIQRAGTLSYYGVRNRLFSYICDGVTTSYKVQMKEGMQPLPEVTGSIASKYLGGGHGGYALYLFDNEEARNASNLIRVEPYLK